MNEIDIELRLNDHEHEIKSLKHRMTEQESQSKALNDLALSVKELAINMNIIVDNQESQNKRLADLETKPAKRWETIVTCLITTIVGAVIGFLLSRIGL